jgi:hypothetical protein
MRQTTALIQQQNATIAALTDEIQKRPTSLTGWVNYPRLKSWASSPNDRETVARLAVGFPNPLSFPSIFLEISS